MRQPVPDLHGLHRPRGRSCRETGEGGRDLIDLADSLRHEAWLEAQDLLRWWSERLPDEVHGGFYGEIGNDGRPVLNAPKSAILNMRLLWFFSALGDLPLARRAMHYLRDHFLTPEGNGVVWLLDHTGMVIDRTRFAHAQGYAICALAAYHRATGEDEVLTIARRIQTAVETQFWTGNGYADCLDGPNDGSKTLGAHLHLLEGYSHLHHIAPDAVSQAALHRALDVFTARFAREGAHIPITFEADWTPRSGPISRGHDAEAGWLIWQAAVTLGDAALLVRIRPLTLSLAQLTLANHNRIKEWWGQAEALIAFVNAWQMTGDTQWLEAATELWNYVKARFGARSGRDWSWYADDSGQTGPYQAGMWKCPYHTGRAMLELECRLTPSAPGCGRN